MKNHNDHEHGNTVYPSFEFLGKKRVAKKKLNVKPIFASIDAQKLTVTDFCRKCEMDTLTFLMFLRCEDYAITEENLRKIAKGMEISLEELLKELI